jgi:agmatinase
MDKKISQSKLKKISAFDPGAIGLDNGHLFGLPFNLEESEVVVIPVPWEVTVSYGGGAADGPEAVFDASRQVDLFDPDMKESWKLGIAMVPFSEKIAKQNRLLRKKAEKCIVHLEKGGKSSDVVVKKIYDEINDVCEEMNAWLEKESARYLKDGKSVCVLGGDHSSPLGFMKALGKVHDNYSILHLDAHADFRVAYEGFEYSHASIQQNASKLKCVERIVMAGIRDYSERESADIKNSRGKVVMFGDREIKRAMYAGKKWDKICDAIVSKLSKKVYVSFDIDVLEPSLCPNTGTPVPGGFDLEQVLHLVRKIILKGKKIIGFDLCEVSGKGKNGWDAVVGVRALFRMANLMALSQGKLKNGN